MSDVELYANPYAFDAHGFYFTSLDDFKNKYKKNLPVEEYEIDFIDGSDADIALFKMLGVNAANLDEYFDKLDDFDSLREDEQAAMFYAFDELGETDYDAAKRRVDQEIRVMEGDEKDYAEDYIDNIGGALRLGKKTLEMYFDYAGFGSDVKIDLDTDDENDAYILEMSDEDAGIYAFENWGEPPPAIMERYFDLDAFARDIRLNGDVKTFEYAGKTWVTDTV